MPSPEFSSSQEKTLHDPIQEWFNNYSLFFPQDRLYDKILRRPNPVWLNPNKVVDFIYETRSPTELQLTASIMHPQKQVVIYTFERHTLYDNHMVILLMRFADSDPKLITDMKSNQQVKWQESDRIWQKRMLDLDWIIETVKSDPAFQTHSIGNRFTNVV